MDEYETPSHSPAHWEYDALVRRDSGLAEMVAEHAQTIPTHPALTDGTHTWTYRELHDHAKSLAGTLHRSAALDREEPVGILVPHGVLDAIAQVAVLYAGATCVPLDPGLPLPQIQSRLERLGTRYVLVDGVNGARGLPFQCIAVDGPTDTRQTDVELSRFPLPTDLEHRTHLIHTSGTTGLPKVVQIAARSILEVAYHAPFAPVRPTDVVAHANQSSFDVALIDVWGPLLRGARMAVIAKTELLDLDLLGRRIRELGITFMATTTALLNLAASTAPAVFQDLRMCWIGGEAANVEAIRLIFEAGPPRELINAYGPTECCILATAHRVSREDLAAGAVSIGQGIGRTVTRVCDERGQPVAPGTEGELWIGGPGVSPGYLGLPEQTAALFVTVESGVRMYRTGDIVRQRDDGQIDYVGRRDNQVKVRGFRVELESIERALLQTGFFTEAVVVNVSSWQDGDSSMLIAFVVERPEHLGACAVSALQAALPPYMIPRIERRDSLPLTSHAKVDRRELARQYRESAMKQHNSRCVEPEHADHSAAGPQGSTRAQLARLWSTLLNVKVSPDDATADFFQLGGTSLQAALLINRVKEAFGVAIPLLTLYDHTSLESFSALLQERQGGTQSETVRNEAHIWQADSQLVDDIPTPPLPAVDWCRDTEGRVMLTGATGFVGAFFLADLLRRPGVFQVGCLVRASSPAVGMRRLRQALEKYQLWEEAFAARLLPLCGDLEADYLGLGAARFDEIARWASVVFHLGARVNYTQPYSRHRPANTIGTLNVIRLACTGRTKALHYMSSISCFGPTGKITGAKNISEEENLVAHLPALPYDHGYAQSQWVAEQMLRRLMDRQFPITVYRPGFITGHSQTGACNPDDFFSRMIAACLEMGCYPDLPNQRKEFVTVDWVITASLAIASSPAALGHSFHLVPSAREDSPDMNDSMAMVGPMERVSYDAWLDRLEAAPPERLQPLQPMLTERVWKGRSRWELYEDMPVYDTSNTTRVLSTAAKDLVMPPLTPELLRRYIDFLGIDVSGIQGKADHVK